MSRAMTQTPERPVPIKRIRVLVADDSAFARASITKTLSADGGIEIVGSARDGREAVDLTSSLRPDVVTMDVTMPGMDGLAALTRIMEESPTPVVMVSALTGEQTNTTIEALELGAVDFFLKPSFSSPAGNGGVALDLMSKIREAAKVRISNLRPGLKSRRAPRPAKKTAHRPGVPNKVLVIGASTGGPRALGEVIPDLQAEISAAVLIVQHMPEGFTTSLAKRLERASRIGVSEAKPGDTLSQGHALVAPGGYHMRVSKRGVIDLSQDPPVCGVRPSVDVTMASVAEAYGAASMGIVLTGMGSDGTNGAALIKGAGGAVAVEDESTCAVYGMPRSVVETGAADRIVPLPEMAEQIARMCAH